MQWEQCVLSAWIFVQKAIFRYLVLMFICDIQLLQYITKRFFGLFGWTLKALPLTTLKSWTQLLLKSLFENFRRDIKYSLFPPNLQFFGKWIKVWGLERGNFIFNYFNWLQKYGLMMRDFIFLFNYWVIYVLLLLCTK